jgi:hypothetical protein
MMLSESLAKKHPALQVLVLHGKISVVSCDTIMHGTLLIRSTLYIRKWTGVRG